MSDNQRAFAAANIAYHPYVEPRPGHGRGLLVALAERACLVVTDEVPGFFLPRMVAAAGAKIDARLEQVDGNGLLPLRAAGREYPTAYAFRRVLQKELPKHLARFPLEEPLALAEERQRGAAFPDDVLERWPAPSAALLRGEEGALAELPIDHAANMDMPDIMV